MLHLIKLAVGARGPADVAAFQAERLREAGHLHHLTRLYPRRAAELLDGGSLYWVISGAIQLRQRLLGIDPDSRRQDGTPAAALVLDPALVAVAPRGMRPFQGWRYLAAADAPPDLSHAGGAAKMPAELRRELAVLGLL